MPKSKTDRNALIVQEINATARTLTDIALEHGVSRERIRQIYRNATGSSSSRKPGSGGVIDGSLVFKAIRLVRSRADIDSWSDLGRALDIHLANFNPRGRMTSVLRELDMLRPIDRLFRMRRRRNAQHHIINQLKEHSRKVGRPPTVNDLLQCGGHLVALSTVYKHFGSFNNALEAAGFPLNRARFRYRKAKRNRWGLCKSQRDVPPEIVQAAKKKRPR